MQPCPICQHNTFQMWHKAIFDDRYGHPDLFNVIRCKHCGLFLSTPRLNPDSTRELYRSYYPPQKLVINQNRNAKNSSAVRYGLHQAFRRWINGDHKTARLLPPGHGKVLDIGCGDGRSLVHLQSLGYTAVGLEVNADTVAYGQANGLDIRFGIIEQTQFQEAEFDIIIANQLIEHVTDLDAFFTNIHRALKPNGKIILSTPNGNSLYRRLCGRKWINWHIPYHQQIFTPNSLCLIAAINGLEVRKLKTVTPSQWTLHQIARLLEKPVPGHKSIYWSKFEIPKDESEKSSNAHPAARRSFKKIFLPFVKLAIIFANRFIDLLGTGDCLMIILSHDLHPHSNS